MVELILGHFRENGQRQGTASNAFRHREASRGKAKVPETQAANARESDSGTGTRYGALSDTVHQRLIFIATDCHQMVNSFTSRGDLVKVNREPG